MESDKEIPICLVDYAEQQGGHVRPPDGMNTKTCPNCGSEVIAGYGLMGGGVGAYLVCDGERNDATVGMVCEWFYKEQDRT